MKALERISQFRFHHKCKEMRITHLEFVDDLMFVCRADRKSPLLMMDVFEDFSVVSGLQVNQLKSSIFFGGVKEEDKAFLLEALGFREGSLPVRYLGLPLIPSKLIMAYCAPVIEKVELITIDVEYSYLLPKSVQMRIDSLCGKFLWSGSTEKESMTLVSWQRESMY